jgi:hypothetical protein
MPGGLGQLRTSMTLMMLFKSCQKANRESDGVFYPGNLDILHGKR